jgi:serine/threonine-protein kinase
MVGKRRHALARGERLGKYEILSEIGRGGMAELYLARTAGIEGFEKLVALKRILPHHADDPDFVDMFLDEARLAARLNHPNIAQVYDIGEHGGSYFFAMEYLHGRDLSHVLKTAAEQGRGMSLDKALTIVTQVAAGLQHAHDVVDSDGTPLNLVHRDVSLSNILVTYDGMVKIVDFGIAKAMSRRSRTRTGNVKGKIAYLSPEQCRGDDIDRRSDVFALGIVLFELTTGTRMFGQLDDVAIMHKLCFAELPTPSSRRPDYPEALEELVMRALAREPDDRFESARALQEALEHHAREAKLTLSNIALGKLMHALYGEPTHPTNAIGREPSAGTADRVGAERTRGTHTMLSSTMPRLPMRSRAPQLVLLAAVVAVAFGLWRMSTDDDRATASAPSTDAVTTSAIPSAPPAATVEPTLPLAEPSPAPPPESPPADTATQVTPKPVAVTPHTGPTKTAPKAPKLTASATPPAPRKPRDDDKLLFE